MHLFLPKRTLVPLVLKTTQRDLKGDSRGGGDSSLHCSLVKLFLLRSLAAESLGCSKTDSWILPQAYQVSIFEDETCNLHF